MKYSKFSGSACANYQDTYRNWRDYDKLTGVNCLADENRYTFADDMTAYDTPAELNDYIVRMLNTHCRNNKQGYFEMILATMTMSWVFKGIGADDMSRKCADWYYKLFYNRSFSRKYIITSEIEDLMMLR